MPSLNVAPYIQACMDSVVGQTFRDIEILCVDAGSTDGTLEILERYARLDSRVHVLHSPKRSYGYQLNMGFRAARGKYAGIVETDDYIDTRMFEALYTAAEEGQYEFAKSNFRFFMDTSAAGRVFLDYTLFPSAHGPVQVSALDYMRAAIPYDSFMWNGIYRLDFIRKNGIVLDETPGAAYQDAGFRAQVALLVQKGVYLPDLLYFYRRDNGASSMHSPNGLQYDLQESRYILDWVQKRFPGDPARIRAASREIAKNAVHSFKQAISNPPDADGKTRTMHEFRKLLQACDTCGSLMQADFEPDIWLGLRLLLDAPACFYSYLSGAAGQEIRFYRGFLKAMRSRPEIVLFGCGKKGKQLYCLLSGNGIDSVSCFCDNDRSLWGTTFGGRPVISPNKAAADHPHAFFLLTHLAHYREMLHQLLDRHVPAENIDIYRLPLDPMACTSRWLDDELDNDSGGNDGE